LALAWRSVMMGGGSGGGGWCSARKHPKIVLVPSRSLRGRRFRSAPAPKYTVEASMGIRRGVACSTQYAINKRKYVANAAILKPVEPMNNSTSHQVQYLLARGPSGYINDPSPRLNRILGDSPSPRQERHINGRTRARLYCVPYAGPPEFTST
jgi:hypothetical protein